MKIDTFALGEFQTNSFCVRADEETKTCVIIDTGLGSEPLLEFLQAHRLKPVAVLLTHGHADHIEGVGLLREHYPDIEVVIHKKDAVMFTDPMANVSGMLGMPITLDPPDVLIDAEGPITYAGITFHVLHTPGHTPGGVSFYCPDRNLVFVGDTLFAGSIGRTDFPGGNLRQLLDSICTRLLTLPNETTVYNGHGPVTSIGNEKRHNPFLQGQ
ncbi:MAG: MBL fold metallo-hydrolase [Sedimentisphaerales bacterium]|nr:MBL fold metallo-hydrolase [Sedimentisphaerales bacterium]